MILPTPEVISAAAAEGAGRSRAAHQMTCLPLAQGISPTAPLASVHHLPVCHSVLLSGPCAIDTISVQTGMTNAAAEARDTLDP